MHIDTYRFGTMVIDGKTYTDDLLIIRDRVEPDWWREKGHRLGTEDIATIIAAGPDILIVGTGADGRMRVPGETADSIRNHHIRLEKFPTGEAVDAFNSRIAAGDNVVGAFHLTC